MVSVLLLNRLDKIAGSLQQIEKTLQQKATRSGFSIGKSLLGMIGDAVYRIVEGFWASFIGAYFLPRAVDKLRFYRTLEGTVFEEHALRELAGLIFSVSLLGMRSEVAEFYFEAMSDAFTDIFERAFKGALEWKAKTLFGQESLDDDEIKDCLSTGLFKPKFASYVSIASGLFNSAVYVEVLTGLSYARERQYKHIHDSVLFHIITLNEAWEYRFEWQLEEARDSLRDMYKWTFGQVKDNLTRIIYLTAYAERVYDQCIWLVESSEEVTDDLKEAVNTLLEDPKTLLQREYEIAEGTIQTYYDNASEIDTKYKEFIRDKYAPYRKKIYKQLIDILEKSLDKMEEYADEVLTVINRMRGSNLQRGEEFVVDAL